jgi:RecA-family ATPase
MNDKAINELVIKEIRPAAPATPTKGNGAGEPLPKLVPIRFVKGETIPPREWTVPHWVPEGTITLLQGNGGDGKTPLVQQLLTSCAAALPWIGLPVKECATVGFFTEDMERDLKERQTAINANYCLEETPSNMRLFPRLGLENELVSFDGSGKPHLTPFFYQIRETSLDYHVGLIVLDVLVDLFGGDEIRRRQVRAFLRPLLGLGAELPAAIVLTSHVSQAGIQSGGGHSGSTDWSNASRSRAYLFRPQDDQDADSDTDARLLTRKKANFASVGDTIKLRWRNGLLIPEESAPNYFRRSPDETFLAMLDAVTAENQTVSPKSRASNYAPAFFMRRPNDERGDYQRRDFERVMQALLKDGKIKIAPYGPPSADTQKIVRIDREEEPS